MRLSGKIPGIFCKIFVKYPTNGSYENTHEAIEIIVLTDLQCVFPYLYMQNVEQVNAVT